MPEGVGASPLRPPDPRARTGGTLQPPPRVWLIGENNPYQSDAEDGQRYAMYPEPPESAGGRLCHLILGMEQRAYLRAFERRNLLHQPRWSVKDARAAAFELRNVIPLEAPVLLLGAKVWEAWMGQPSDRLGAKRWEPLTVHCLGRVLALPHPSGLSRYWNDFKSYSAVRAFVAQHVPHLAPLLGRSPLTRGRTAAERGMAHVG